MFSKYFLGLYCLGTFCTYVVRADQIFLVNLQKIYSSEVGDIINNKLKKKSEKYLNKINKQHAVLKRLIKYKIFFNNKYLDFAAKKLRKKTLVYRNYMEELQTFYKKLLESIVLETAREISKNLGCKFVILDTAHVIYSENIFDITQEIIKRTIEKLIDL